MTYGLTHLAIAVNDLERTLNFYQAVFDMKLMYQEKNMIQLTTPGCNDILVFQRTEEPVDDLKVDRSGCRIQSAKEDGRSVDSYDRDRAAWLDSRKRLRRKRRAESPRCQKP